MSWFGKNPNEAAYPGGKKHFADVIKNTGPGELLIWKQPEEDFNTNSTLIVMPGEEAIFIKGGNIEQVFGNGTYRLSTSNYPFISRLRNAFTGGISAFNCVVYFVRKADSQEIKWGTKSAIQVRDNVWGIRTDVKARGAYKVRIENPAQFLEKLIGGNIPYHTQEELNKYFESEFQGKIRSVISDFLNSLNQELIGIDAYLDDLSEKITSRIDDVVKDYGLKCVKFSLAGLEIDASKYDEIDKSQIESIRKVKLAQGDKGAMNVLGDDWGRLQAAGILGDLANNPGTGGVGAMGAGMGMGVAAGNAFSNMANQMFAPMNPHQSSQQSPPTSSGSSESNGAGETPSSSQGATADPMETLTKLKKMLEAGLIEQSEFDAKKAEILRRM